MNLGHGSGPIPSRIMLCGEAWGENEDRERTPFVGASGQELNRMLAEAGIMRSECYATNLVNARPPSNDIGAWIALRKKDITHAHVALRDKWVLPIVVEGYHQLLQEIAMVQPNIIVAFGNSAMWALTGRWGILKMRGSQLAANLPQMSTFGLASIKQEGGLYCRVCQQELPRCVCDGPLPPPKVIPVLHPAAILREWSARAIAVGDLRRVKREIGSRIYENVPAWNFIVRPSLETVCATLTGLDEKLYHREVWIDFDIETKAGHIDCIAISWSRLDAICIPFMTKANKEGYWSLDEEAYIVWRLYNILTNKNARVRWQNGLYDAQYTYRWWHFIPRGAQDTMISHHVAFSGMRKSLDFQASMYCDYYVQWKPDKSSWKEGG